MSVTEKILTGGSGMGSKGSKTLILLSVFCGICFTAVSYFIMECVNLRGASTFSVLTGALFSALLYLFLVIYQRHTDKKYLNFEKTMSSHVFYKTNGNFRLAENIRNGNIYFCDDKIVFAFLDEKPFLTEYIPVDDISYYQYDNIHLNIATKDGRVYRITLPDAAPLTEILKTRGWIEK